MATTKVAAKKSTSSRTKTAAKKTTAKKPVVVAKSAPAKAVKPEPVAKLTVSAKTSLFPANLANIILAELVGTFILAMVTLTAFGVMPFMAVNAGVLSSWLVDPLFIGLTLTLLMLGIGAVSGAHVNPAVTFGFWTMRRLKTVMVPVYWLSQFLGALLAVGVANVMTGGQFAIGLGSFAQLNVPLMFMELIGTAILMFGIAGVLGRKDVSNGSQAFGYGIALTVALVAGTSMLLLIQKADYKKYTDSASSASSSSQSAPVAGRSLSIDGPVLNPAVALAAREDPSVKDRLAQQTTDTSKTEPSRFGLEVILGSLIGAAVGGNLYLLLSFRPKNEA